MDLLELYESNKDTYNKNKKEILTKLINKDYNENGRIIVAKGIDKINIYEHNLKFLEDLPMSTLEMLFEFIISYRFTTD